MKRQFVFEDVKLGTWNDSTHYINVPLDIRNHLKGKKYSVKLKRKNYGGESNPENVTLILVGENKVRKNINSLKWGETWESEIDNSYDLDLITTNKFIHLDELVITY